MDIQSPIVSHYGLENHGIKNVNFVYWNLASAMLYEEIIRRREGPPGSPGAHSRAYRGTHRPGP